VCAHFSKIPPVIEFNEKSTELLPSYFVCGSFNEYVVSDDGMINECESIWK
jgi:hypothetical protein